MGDKWGLLLIGVLYSEKTPARFNELMRKLNPISSRTLSIKLTKLRKHGIVQKVSAKSSPHSTHYSLTEKGNDFVSALKAMTDWSLKWQKQFSNRN
jgi:DNA-binding HxlR family transcriptional regulator